MTGAPMHQVGWTDAGVRHETARLRREADNVERRLSTMLGGSWAETGRTLAAIFRAGANTMDAEWKAARANAARPEAP